MAPTMKKGQMTVVLTWGEWPSDLDLWVMAPAKRNGGRNAEIGGGSDRPPQNPCTRLTLTMHQCKPNLT